MINELLSLDEVLTARSLFRAALSMVSFRARVVGIKKTFFNSNCFVHVEGMNKTFFVVLLDER